MIGSSSIRKMVHSRRHRRSWGCAPLDISNAEIPNDVVKGGLRLPTSDVAVGLSSPRRQPEAPCWAIVSLGLSQQKLRGGGMSLRAQMIGPARLVRKPMIAKVWNQSSVTGFSRASHRPANPAAALLFAPTFPANHGGRLAERGNGASGKARTKCPS
jgi:hypothetical protein